VWGTVAWCIAAAIVALTLWPYTYTRVIVIPEQLYRPLFWIFVDSFKVYFALTPIVIGLAVYRSHVSAGMGDESLRDVPLKPHQLLLPRMAAVGLTWLQFAAPLAFLFIAWPIQTNNMLDMPEWLRESFLMEAVRCIMIFVQVVGWGLLWLTWGFWWGSFYQRRGGLFLIAYVSFLLLPACLYAIEGFGIPEWLFGYTEGRWTTAIFTCACGILLSARYFALACRAWGRRAK
jgi:hypothetical protein